MVDANQIWDVDQAINWMEQLADFHIWWIEEPTSPDDALGHAKIAAAVRPLGIGVASGEACMNRIMFKQFLQCNALDFCQIDSARIGGVNEILAVYLMAKKFNGMHHFIGARGGEPERGNKNNDNFLIIKPILTFISIFFIFSESLPARRWSWFVRNGATFANVGFYISSGYKIRPLY